MEKLAVCPAVTVTLTGCWDIAGAVVAELTVSETVSLFVVPAEFETLT
jgi:hypothetical protein